MSDLYPPEMGPTPDARRQTPAAERKARSATFWRRAFILVGVLFLATSMTTNVVLGVVIHQTQLGGTPTGKKLVASADRILDCTDPKGDKDSCYAKNQRQTAELVGQIGAGNILAVVCALQVPNGTPLQQALDQVTVCVADRLAHPKP